MLQSEENLLLESWCVEESYKSFSPKILQLKALKQSESSIIEQARLFAFRLLVFFVFAGMANLKLTFN